MDNLGTYHVRDSIMARVSPLVNAKLIMVCFLAVSCFQVIGPQRRVSMVKWFPGVLPVP